jgi:hypothetical protein
MGAEIACIWQTSMQTRDTALINSDIARESAWLEAQSQIQGKTDPCERRFKTRDVRRRLEADGRRTDATRAGEALQEAHDKWLREQPKKQKDPQGALAAFVDQSVPNLSSIVVLAELGGKRMLLTGDACGEDSGRARVGRHP